MILAINQINLIDWIFFLLVLGLPDADYYLSYKEGLDYEPSSNPRAIILQFLFYYDDFKLTSNAATNMAVCYFTLLNLPYWLQSSRDEISLILITKRSTLDVITFDAFFELLIKDFFKINNNPIRLSNGFQIRLNLKASSADNVGKLILLALSSFI